MKEESKVRIFLNSMPKAGTNLVSRVFDLSGIPYGRLGIAGTLVLGNRYPIRQLLRRSFFEKDPIILGLEAQMPVRRYWLDRRLGRVQMGAYVTGHANWSMGLEKLLAKHGYRTALVIRDPLDVIISHGHYVASSKDHFLNATYRRLDLTQRTLLTLRGGRIDGLDVAPFLIMLERINRWMSRPGVEIIRFEDVIGPRGGGNLASQHEVFDRLSKLTGRAFDHQLLENDLFGNSHTFRKGKIGSAYGELDQQTLQIVEAELGPMRRQWGYSVG